MHHHFEKDPADDNDDDEQPTHTDPDSWGLGVLYEERRVDGDNAYTKHEFVAFYGGTDEWDAAPPAAHQQDDAAAATD